MLGARSSGLIGPQPNASYASSTYRFVVSFSFIFQAGGILTKAGIKRDIVSGSMREDKVYPETVSSTCFSILFQTEGSFTNSRRMGTRR